NRVTCVPGLEGVDQVLGGLIPARSGIPDIDRRTLRYFPARCPWREHEDEPVGQLGAGFGILNGKNGFLEVLAGRVKQVRVVRKQQVIARADDRFKLFFGCRKISSRQIKLSQEASRGAFSRSSVLVDTRGIGKSRYGGQQI